MADSEYVTVRHPHIKDERTVAKDAIPFFTNQGYEVLDSSGRVNKAASSAASEKKEG